MVLAGRHRDADEAGRDHESIGLAPVDRDVPVWMERCLQYHGRIVRTVGPEFLAQRMEFRTDCPNDATVVLKTTFHPNWHVAIDGREADTFMVSPSFIGVAVPAGKHHLIAEYRTSTLKKVLLWVGV